MSRLTLGYLLLCAVILFYATLSLFPKQEVGYVTEVSVVECKDIKVAKIIKSRFFDDTYLITGIVENKIIDEYYFGDIDMKSIRMGDELNLCSDRIGNKEIRQITRQA